MQPPSDPAHQRYSSPGMKYSPFSSGLRSSSQQAYPNQKPFKQASPDAAGRLPTSRWQKLFIALALLGTSGLVLYLPFLILQQTFFPATPPSTSARSAPPVTQASVLPTLTPTPTLGPMGTTILPPKGQILTGVSLASSDPSTLTRFETEVGKKTSIVLLYQAWGDKNAANFPQAWASFVRQEGSLPLITWEPWITRPYPLSNNEPAYSLKNIINGDFDAYITKWADDAKSWRNPFFLRFAPEMNGYWTPWSEGLNNNKIGEFVKAWRHVHDIFTAVGATNVTWVWCPNVPYAGSLPLTQFYPGDAYVDWTALDGFNWGKTTQGNSWLTFSQVFHSAYQTILNLTSKPMMIAETSSVEQGGSKAAWISDAYSVQLPTYFSAIKAIVWFNQITQQNWSIDSSPGSLAAFSKAIRAKIYASNSFATYTGG